jgi:2-hydroxychromene-2-carboxylate isomerase
MTPVEFYFDVSCPWTWMTSRWMTDVAPQRDLDITWRTFSLKSFGPAVALGRRDP